MLDFPGSWDRYNSPYGICYNNSYQTSIGMASYEALYDRKCRTPICWTDLNGHKVIAPDIVKEIEENVRIIQQRLKATSDIRKGISIKGS